MLTITGERPVSGGGSCDRISRRGFLTVGGMALGGLSLGQLLALEDASGRGRSHRAVINVFLPGGPSHIDMWDLKPDAPREVRGEFSPMKTNVPGMEICELFPRLARMADKFAIIRSLVGSDGDHDGYQCMTGRSRRRAAPDGGWPAFGAAVSKIQGPASFGVPPHLALFYTTGHRQWGEPGKGGFLGPAHAPTGLFASRGTGPAEGMRLQGITLERLRDRRRLLESLDGFRRLADSSESLRSADHHTQEAFSILTSSRLAEALDLSREDPRVVERYGQDDPTFQRDGAPRMVRNFLLARRLVEAGARIVSLNYSRWDWHGGDGMNFPKSREEFPLLDGALSALIEDLHARGLDREVAVVVWGEFGRTPKINKMNSRDHWPQVNAALLFGGGLRTGHVIGATNRLGERAVSRPVTYGDVFATLYHTLGIDPATATVNDLQGRPQYLVDPGSEPIAELV